ncbi:hypothetical protein [Clostridium perfringens]|nr:hypothetical protein [Clostridium perfringens]
MKLIYIFIKDYDGLLKDQAIDFKSKYKFNFYNNKITISKNKEYLENFFQGYSNIDDITAIVGKNTSGKSSILKLINRIWGDVVEGKNYLELEYLVFFEDKNVIRYHSTLDREFDIEKESLEGVELKKIKVGSMYNTTFLYFSGIFDRNQGLKENSKFIDISTNNLVRKSIKKTYVRKRQMWNSKRNVNLEIESEQIEFVDEFRKQETFKLMNYYRKIIDLEWAKEILFDFPKRVSLIFQHNYIMAEEFKNFIVEDKHLSNIIKQLF